MSDSTIRSWMLCGPDGPTGRFSLVTAHVKGNTVCVFGVVKNRYQTCLFYRLELCVLSPIRMRQKYTRVNILRCVFILRCANQPESKFKLRSHGFYRQEYFCR